MNKLSDIKNTRLFWSKVEKTNTCWIWKGQLGKPLPYGLYGKHKAHRVSWMLSNNKDWPEPLIARHTCHNHSCVNPNHIIPGTHKENWEDSRDVYIKAMKEKDLSYHIKRAKKKCKKISTPFGIFDSIKDAKSKIKMSPNTLHKLLKTYNSGYHYLEKERTMSINATGTRYVIKATELELESAGGIILKTTDATQFATIISVGSRVENALPVGAKIVVDWNHTVPVKHENETYYVIDSRAVAAVFEE